MGLLVVRCFSPGSRHIPRAFHFSCYVFVDDSTLKLSLILTIHRHILISRTFFLLSTMFLSRSSLSALFAFAVFGSANASCPSGNDPNCAWGEEDLLL